MFFLIGFLISAFNQTVTIGSQVWMTENLNVSKFRNGDFVPHVESNEKWTDHGPKWCYYDNDSKNGLRYGKLYNWFAVNGPKDHPRIANCNYQGKEYDAILEFATLYIMTHHEYEDPFTDPSEED